VTADGVTTMQTRPREDPRSPVRRGGRELSAPVVFAALFGLAAGPSQAVVLVIAGGPQRVPISAEEVQSVLRPEAALETAERLGEEGEGRLELNANYAAEPLLRRALVILEDVLGPTDARLIPGLTALGDLYADQGRYTRAEPFYRRALALLEAAGAEDIRLFLPTEALAQLYVESGQPNQAESRFIAVASPSSRRRSAPTTRMWPSCSRPLRTCA
jgi:tetratricopeptide (TPR) repeat protein